MARSYPLIGLLLGGCAVPVADAPDDCSISELYDEEHVPFEWRVSFLAVVDEGAPVPALVDEAIARLEQRIREGDADLDGERDGWPPAAVEALVRRDDLARNRLSGIILENLPSGYHGTGTELVVVVFTTRDPTSNVASELAALEPAIAHPGGFQMIATGGGSTGCTTADGTTVSPAPRLSLLSEVSSPIGGGSVPLCHADWATEAYQAFRHAFGSDDGVRCYPRPRPHGDDGTVACTVREELHAEAPFSCHDLPGREPVDGDPRVCGVTQLADGATGSGWAFDVSGEAKLTCGDGRGLLWFTADAEPEEGSRVVLHCLLFQAGGCGT